jgi:hypothetical protein
MRFRRLSRSQRHHLKNKRHRELVSTDARMRLRPDLGKTEMSKKILRTILFGFVCVITLLALIITEENLRGKMAWEKLKRDFEAKGERMEMSAFIPPPVPDDQNLAATDFFRPLESEFKTGKSSENYRDTAEWKLQNFTGGNLNARAALDHMPKGNWQTGNPRGDLTYWQEYYRKAFPQLNLSGSPEEDIITATDQLNSIFAELRDAIKTHPYCRFDIQYQMGPEARLPHLSEIQNLVNLLDLRAIAEVRTNRTGEACDDIVLAFHVINTIRDEPFLITGLVRIGLEMALMEPIWEGIAVHRWSDSQLDAFQDELREFDYLSDYCREMRFERSVEPAMMDYAIHDPRIMGMSLAANEELPTMALASVPAMRALSGAMYQNLIRQANWIQDSISTVDTAGQKLDVPRINRLREEVEQMTSTPYNIFTKLSTEQIAGVVERFAQIQCYTNAAIVACSIEEYYLAHHALPNSLDDLHINNLPHDVLTGEPLHYRADGADNYLLYSVGWSLNDDGGKVVLNERGLVDRFQGNWTWSLKPLVSPASEQEPPFAH